MSKLDKLIRENFWTLSTKYLSVSSVSSASWSVESTWCLLQSCDIIRHLRRSSSKTLFGILAAAEGTTLPKKFVLKKCYDNNNEETKHAKLQKLCYKKNPNQNEGQKNLKLNILSHRCPIRGHKSSRRSKLNNGSSREIRMVISFQKDVRFGDILYWDARNWKTEALEKIEWS